MFDIETVNWRKIRIAGVLLLWLVIAGLMVHNYMVVDPPLTHEEARLDASEGYEQNIEGDLRTMLLLSAGEVIMFLAVSGFWEKTVTGGQMAMALTLFVGVLLAATVLLSTGGGVEDLHNLWVVLLIALLAVALVVTGLRRNASPGNQHDDSRHN